MQTLQINIIDKVGNITNTQYIEDFSGVLPNEGEKVVLDQDEFSPKIPHDPETFLTGTVWKREFHFATKLVRLNIIF